MRPKVVLLTLLVAVGLVAAMAILKGARQPPATPPSPVQPTVQEQAHSNPPERSSTSVAAQAPVPDAETLAQKITDIQAEGAPTPEGRAVLLAALKEAQDKEVRKAALNAIVQLDDTGAVPGLEQALPQIADPHDKAAVLDAIEQLKLPNTTPDVAVTGDMRSHLPPGLTIKHNPRFLGTSSRGPKPSLGTVPPPSQPAAAPDAQQPQPPDTSPPQ